MYMFNMNEIPSQYYSSSQGVYWVDAATGEIVPHGMILG